MRDMSRHFFDSMTPANPQKPLFVRGIELQQGRPVLKALGPFSPAARPVLATNSENGCASRRLPRLFEGEDFLRRKFKEPIELRQQLGGGEAKINLDCHDSRSSVVMTTEPKD